MAMSRQYRFLQYVADPFAGRCVTVAALIRDIDGSMQVILAPTSPGPEELGSIRAANLLASLWRDIAALASFERLPRSFGPQLILNSPEPIPSDDPVGWVQARLLAAAA
jgi:hypothetical protein